MGEAAGKKLRRWDRLPITTWVASSMRLSQEDAKEGSSSSRLVKCRSWKQCYKRVSSLRLRHYLQAPFLVYQTNTSPRRSNKSYIILDIIHNRNVQNVPY
ncbi:hypothetical protein SEVIR_9G087800v4 [Setaria viridis]|uniref:Uncharacterized protein n=2 Tax=Setaria TaxID=4554 RepID=A0A368SGD6_SETIT|nr:hypothetical protein SETIT_9G089300v2 [Setaria italica]TKV91316.1 hypothetical protein SEVIR_9G087800v2 [Setaria viridis]